MTQSEPSLRMQREMRPLEPRDLPLFDARLQPCDVVDVYREPISREGCEGRATLRRKLSEIRLSDGNGFELWKLSFIGESAMEHERWIRVDRPNAGPVVASTPESRGDTVSQLLDVAHLTTTELGAAEMDVEVARGLLRRALEVTAEDSDLHIDIRAYLNGPPLDKKETLERVQEKVLREFDLSIDESFDASSGSTTEDTAIIEDEDTPSER